MILSEMLTILHSCYLERFISNVENSSKCLSSSWQGTIRSSDGICKFCKDPTFPSRREISSVHCCKTRRYFYSEKVAFQNDFVPYLGKQCNFSWLLNLNIPSHYEKKVNKFLMEFWHIRYILTATAFVIWNWCVINSLMCAHNLCDVPSTPSDMCHQCCDVRHHWMFDHTICHKCRVYHTPSLIMFGAIRRFARIWNAVFFFKAGPENNPDPPLQHLTHFNSNLSEKLWPSKIVPDKKNLVFSAFFVLILIHWVSFQ